MHRFVERFASARQLGLKGTIELVRRRYLFSTELMLELHCDLTTIPPLRPAKSPLEGQFENPTSFGEFAIAAAATQGNELPELQYRQNLCKAGVHDLFVARLKDGRVAYVQWCINAADLPVIQSVSDRRYRSLTANEVLLEAAYTFPSARGMGAMSEGSGQLLRKARERGATQAVTFVAATNAPSLRGCAAVGFVLAQTRLDRSMLGVRNSSYGPITQTAASAWERAIHPRVR